MALQFNYASLRGRIKELGFTQESLAEASAMSPTMLSQKLNGKFPFTQTDIQNIVCALDIDASEIGRYFFTA